MAPAETSYLIHADEHLEMTGTFQYDLDLYDGTITWPPPVKMDAEVWDKDWWDEVIATAVGPTITISHTFTGGHDDGTCLTRFFFDNNTNGTSTTGTNYPKVDSPTRGLYPFI